MNEDTKRELKILRLKVIEKLISFICGEVTSTNVWIESTKETIIPADKKVRKWMIVKMVDNYPDVDMDVTPVRFRVMTTLWEYHKKVLAVKGETE